jgi:hypothetical protein
MTELSETDDLSPGPTSLSKNGSSGNVGRVVDPDDYNLRRRLKQLHDAKEAVKERKDNVLSIEQSNRQFNPRDRDRFVVEKLVDYIHELRPLLKKIGREEQFLDEAVETPVQDAVTIQSIINSRGYMGDEDGYLSYQASMAAWDVCNGYFEDVAGAVFEERSPEPEANPVDPAGRFDNE